MYGDQSGEFVRGCQGSKQGVEGGGEHYLARYIQWNLDLTNLCLPKFSV